jgi:Skp family chaperone for outer membrane proteins
LLREKRGFSMKMICGVHFSTTARVVISAIFLFMMALIPIYAASQTTAPGQQAGGQDCEKIKQDIQQLQQELADLSAEMQRETELLDELNKDVAQTQAHLNAITAQVNAGVLNETLRGEELDTLAKVLGLRKQVRQQLEDDAKLIQGIKAEIADLLGKLANCPPPSTTEPSKQETPSPQPPASGTTPQKNKTVSMSGFTPTIQLRGFGGATIVNGNTPSTAGFDGAVLFPLGNRVLVGPTAGFQWVGTSIVSTIGGGPPPSTFINTSVGFKNGNFGGQIGFNLSGWELGIRGGATVASSTITQAEGFCGNGTESGGPAGCTTTSSTTTHDRITSPFVGGYISHSIFSHVGVFAEFDYHRLKDNNVFDLSDRVVVGGVALSFGRHK